jgi:hypothetical protein
LVDPLALPGQGTYIYIIDFRLGDLPIGKRRTAFRARA